MKNSISTIFLLWSLSLWSWNCLAENKELSLVNWKVDSILEKDKSSTNTTSDSLHDKEIEEVLMQTIINVQLSDISDKEKQDLLIVVKNPEFIKKIYELKKEETLWNTKSVSLSLFLWLLYAWAYFSTIHKIRRKWMPIDIRSYSIFGWTSWVMWLLNWFVPGSLVYMESFTLAFTSVYLHLINQKKGVSYEDWLFEKFAENIPLPVVRYNKEGKPLLWNKQMEKETWYSYSEILEYYKEHWDVMTLLYKGENLEKVKQYLNQIQQSWEGYINIAFTLTTKDWREVTFLWTTLPDGKWGTMRIAKHLVDLWEIHTELEKTKELLRRDILTWAYNRLALDEDLQWILTNQRRTIDPENVIMVMIDIDDFKGFNDSYSHKSGDIVLQTFSHFVQSNLREGDRLYRLGWDEFVLLLESNNFKWTLDKLNRVRHSFFIKETVIENDEVVSSIGSSLGVIEFNTWKYLEHNDIKSVIDDLKSQSDEYMYAVKYYRLIREKLLSSWRIKSDWLDKNWICSPIFTDSWEFTWVEVLNEYWQFILSKEELEEIKLIKKEKEKTKRD